MHLVFSQTDRQIAHFSGVNKHKKAPQALGRSLQSFFEQLAWRTSPAVVRQGEAQHITTQQLNASARRPSHAGRITISLMHKQLRLTLNSLNATSNI